MGFSELTHTDFRRDVDDIMHMNDMSDSKLFCHLGSNITLDITNPLFPTLHLLLQSSTLLCYAYGTWRWSVDM